MPKAENHTTPSASESRGVLPARLRATCASTPISYLKGQIAGLERLMCGLAIITEQCAGVLDDDHSLHAEGLRGVVSAATDCVRSLLNDAEVMLESPDWNPNLNRPQCDAAAVIQ